MRFFLIIVFKGDDSKMSKQNISTTISGDLIVTHLIGQIKTEDVYEWFNGFEQVCQQFISEGRKYKLLVDRKRIHAKSFFCSKKYGKRSSSMKLF